MPRCLALSSRLRADVPTAINAKQVDALLMQKLSFGTSSAGWARAKCMFCALLRQSWKIVAPLKTSTEPIW
jgi:hypothetical protein